MKKSARFDGCLVLASTALMKRARLDNVSMIMATLGANKPIWPLQFLEINQAIMLCLKA